MKNEPFFPCKIPTGEVHANGDPAPTKQHYGITLRDYLAAQAMRAWIEKMGVNFEESVAKRAYASADAMLKVRQR
jgi:hypothetical protein